MLRVTASFHRTPQASIRRAFMADKVIADSPQKLEVLPHNQYETPEDHLSPSAVSPSPLDQFHAWFSEIVSGGKVSEPEAVSLSTATPTGIPSARIVLFKQLDDKGFVFYTNYTSRKSQELLDNPNAAMVFYWREVHRSVRVMGRVEQVDRAESHAYFQSRPIGSKLGAWASHQSSVVQEGQVDARLESLKDRFDGDVPTPEFWGGWRIIPSEMEFWVGKPSRLHDRVRYLRDTEGGWKKERLAP